jgi:hypothetical protein
MDDVSAVAVEHSAEVVKRAGDVDVGNVNMPVFMGVLWLLEASSLLRRLAVPGSDQPCILEHAIDCRRARGDDVAVEHHVGEPSISFERMSMMKVDDRLFLP